jgi:hypothetical protein
MPSARVSRYPMLQYCTAMVCSTPAGSLDVLPWTSVAVTWYCSDPPDQAF